MAILKLLFLTASLARAGVLNQARQEPSTTVPDYFQTTPEVWAGPTVTGLIAPFLAQTNPAPFGQEASFVPNAPLETNLPISGNINRSSIFQLHGQLSSYFPNPVGFGANEYPVPPGSNISQVHLLHRHGSRYPTGTSSVASFGQKVYNLTTNKTASWSGELSFLSNWKYQLGAEILVARGRQELFDSGVLFYYNYGRWSRLGHGSWRLKAHKVNFTIPRPRSSLAHLPKIECSNLQNTSWRASLVWNGPIMRPWK